MKLRWGVYESFSRPEIGEIIYPGITVVGWAGTRDRQGERYWLALRVDDKALDEDGQWFVSDEEGEDEWGDTPATIQWCASKAEAIAEADDHSMGAFLCL